MYTIYLKKNLHMHFTIYNVLNDTVTTHQAKHFKTEITQSIYVYLSKWPLTYIDNCFKSFLS